MEALVQAFLSNLIDLFLRRLSRFPAPLRENFGRWAERLREAFFSSHLAREIVSALEVLRLKSKDLFEALKAELEAVVALQSYALEKPTEQETPAPGVSIDESRRPASHIQTQSRALSASKSLLGSLREALGYLPDWAKGLLKVGEELIEIFGPAR